jgi:hypothetical protein
MFIAPVTRKTTILDQRVTPRSDVPAIVHRGCDTNLLYHVESTWMTYRDQLSSAHLLAGWTAPEHSHWDWRNKSQMISGGGYLLVALESEGECQGLMVISEVPIASKLGSGHVVYVDFLESAPWNLKSPAQTAQFTGVGTALMAEAVRISWECQLQGVVGLHSLPQAEGFYSNLGMTKIGRDPDYYDLSYFEFAINAEFLRLVREDQS